MSSATIDFPVTDKFGRSRTQKAPERCYNCGYFYPEENGEDPYYKCHYPDSEPSAWAPCNQE